MHAEFESQIRCLKCGRFLARDAFPNDRGRPSGKHPYCCACKSAEQRARVHARVEARLLDTKMCHRCGRKEPDVEFAGRNKLICQECREVGLRRERTLDRRIKKKVCRICGEEFDIAVFSTSACRICNGCYAKKPAVRYQVPLMDKWDSKRNTDKERRDKYKSELIDRLGGKCSFCGLVPSDQWPLACFDFHHVGEREALVSRLLHSRRSRTKELDVELKKCVVACANCHRAEHVRLDDERRIRCQQR